MKNIFLLGKDRSTVRKVLAGLLAITINLTGGIGASLLTAEIAYAADTGYTPASASHSPNTWTNPNNAFSSDDSYAVSNNENNQQGFSNFNIPAIPTGSTINGIELAVEAKH